MSGSDEEVEMQVEETPEERTVAHDILDEVTQCQQRLNQQQTALERLQNEGASREQVSALLTEVQNGRLELSNRLTAMEARLEQSQQSRSDESRNELPDSESSTHTGPQSPQTIDPSAAGNPEAAGKKKRRVIR